MAVKTKRKFFEGEMPSLGNLKEEFVMIEDGIGPINKIDRVWQNNLPFLKQQ